MLYKSDIEKLHVRFIIWDFDCSPEEVTEYLGVKPTEVQIKGETREVGTKKKIKLTNKNNAWILGSELPKNMEPDRHLENILEKIRLSQNKKGKLL